MSEVVKDGWTKELMDANRNKTCGECGHPVGDHIYPGYHHALRCDVDYCEGKYPLKTSDSILPPFSIVY